MEIFTKNIIDAAIKENWGTDKDDDRTGFYLGDCFEEIIHDDSIEYSADFTIPTEYITDAVLTDHASIICDYFRYFMINECVFEDIENRINWEKTSFSFHVIDSSYVLSVSLFASDDYVLESDEVLELRAANNLESQCDRILSNSSFRRII